tara:strand:- start:1933 stop:2625 length:693 start_codon:yes stop_codon:yes gene_type:complete
MYWSRKYRVHRCNASKQWGRQFYDGIPKSQKNKKCVSNLPNCNVMTHGREGQIRNTILPNDSLFKNSTNCGRSRKQLITSGLQPKKGKDYCFDYNQYLKNKRHMTYEEKLPSSMPSTGTTVTYGHGGSCGIFDKCNDHLTVYKPNNHKFRQQGAVSSSTRLDRLKLNTIVGSKKCPAPNNQLPVCKGIYENSFGRFVPYKGLYNEQHPENCEPQIRARRRVLGNINNFLC